MLNQHDLSSEEPRISNNPQPGYAEKTIAKIKEIPRRSNVGETGFDAMGIVVLELANDGSPALIVNEPPAPSPADIFHYDQMIRRIQSHYESRFASLLAG